MMRLLAEFIMRGRSQALLVICGSVATILLHWVGAAALALVTLRRGAAEGLRLLLWALLPAVAVLLFAREFAPLATLVGTYLAATVLRTTVSWPYALLTATASGAVTGLILLGFADGYVADIKAVVDELLQQYQSEYQSALAAEGQTLEIAGPSIAFIDGIFALVSGLTVALCLVLGRYWQAALYNPGGFGQEFRQLRLEPGLALSLLAVSLLCLMQGGAWLPWGYLALIPCIFAGIGLVHGLAVLKNIKRGWLVLFYVLLLLINPMKELVMLMAVADSFMNFRARVPRGDGS